MKLMNKIRLTQGRPLILTGFMIFSEALESYKFNFLDANFFISKIR
jgi:hypothetical protein